MRSIVKIAGALMTVIVLCAAQGSCTDNDAVSQEQSDTNDAMMQLLRAQPVPVFNYSLERHMLTEIYKARQRATFTYSYVQSEYSGKVLFACPSIGYPIPGATQLTNPQQVTWNSHGDGVVAQPEPNGLYSPASEDATWVPCIGPDGRITPVYEERHVTVFLQQMQEVNGTLMPAVGAKPSFSIAVPAR